MNSTKKEPSFLLALTPILVMIVGLALGVGYMKLKVEPIILIAALVAGGIAWRLGYSWSELQEGVIEKISSSLPALYDNFGRSVCLLARGYFQAPSL